MLRKEEKMSSREEEKEKKLEKVGQERQEQGNNPDKKKKERGQERQEEGKKREKHKERRVGGSTGLKAGESFECKKRDLRKKLCSYFFDHVKMHRFLLKPYGLSNTFDELSNVYTLDRRYLLV